MAEHVDLEYILTAYRHHHNPFHPVRQPFCWNVWESYICCIPTPGSSFLQLPPEPLLRLGPHPGHAAFLFAVWLTYLDRHWWLDYWVFVDQAARYMSLLFSFCCPCQPQVLMHVLHRFIRILHTHPRPSDTLDVLDFMLYNDILCSASAYAGFPIGWVSGPGYQEAYMNWRRGLW
jgi:hypothetical protein